MSEHPSTLEDRIVKPGSAFMTALGLDPLPASTGIQAGICRSDLLVEIEAIAIVPSTSGQRQG